MVYVFGMIKFKNVTKWRIVNQLQKINYYVSKQMIDVNG